MANIVVTTVDANHIKVEFNDYYPSAVPVSTAFYNRTDILKVEVYSNGVTVSTKDAKKWQVHSTGSSDFLQIDNIDGTTTWASLTVLAAQIAALMKA